MKLQLIKKTGPFFGVAVNITTVILLIVDAYHPLPPPVKYSIIGGVSGVSTFVFGLYVRKTLQKRAHQEASKERQIERKREILAEQIVETCKTVRELKELSINSQDVSPRSIHAKEFNFDAQSERHARPRSLPAIPSQNMPRENLQRSRSDSPRYKKSLSPAVPPEPRSRSLSPAAEQQAHYEHYFIDSQARTIEQKIRARTLSPGPREDENDEYKHEESPTPPRRAESAPVRSPYMSVRNCNRPPPLPRFFHNQSEADPEHADWVLPVIPSPVSQNQPS